MEKFKRAKHYNSNVQKEEASSPPLKKFDSTKKREKFFSRDFRERSENSEVESELIFGSNSIKQCLISRKSLSKVFIDNQKSFDHDFLSLLKSKNISISKVPREKLDRMVKGNHQGIVGCISPIDFICEEELINFLKVCKNPVTLVLLNGVTDIRNIGAIIRSAVCVGATAIVLDHGCGRINSEAAHTSAGAIFDINICKARSLVHFINLLKSINVEVIACSEKTDSNIFSLNLRKSVAFLFGSEGVGIEYKILNSANKIAKIPMVGNVSSLNVSVASSVAMYECLRQRMTTSLTEEVK